MTPDDKDPVAEPPETKLLKVPTHNGNSSDASKQIENLSDFLKFGRYTVLVMVLYAFQVLNMCCGITYMVFGGLAPEVTSCGNHTFEGLTTRESCQELRRLRNEGICLSEPQIDAQFFSIAFEFGYFCEEIIWVKKCISAQLIGVLIGALLFGQLSDWFGRKQMMLIGYAGAFAFFLAASMANSLFQFTVIQFFAMVFQGGHSSISTAFMVENMPKKLRVMVMSVFSYSPYYMIFALVAFLLGHWRPLLRFVALLNVLPFLVLSLFVFKSPRWLIHKAQLDEARDILIRMERINGTLNSQRIQTIDNIIAKEVELNASRKSGKRYNYFHLFYTWRMVSYTAVLSYGMMSVSFVAYTVLFNMDRLSGSTYWNMAIFGGLRFLLNLLAAVIDYSVHNIGRKLIYLSCIVLMLAALGTVFACKVFDLNEPALIRYLIITAGVLCAQIFVINHLITSELFPTPVRNVAASFVQMFNRTGVILAPHVFYLAFYWDALPVLIMMLVLGLNFLLFSTFIPETKGKCLSDHMPDSRERIFYKFISREESPKQKANGLLAKNGNGTNLL